MSEKIHAMYEREAAPWIFLVDNTCGKFMGTAPYENKI